MKTYLKLIYLQQNDDEHAKYVINLINISQKHHLDDDEEHAKYVINQYNTN